MQHPACGLPRKPLLLGTWVNKGMKERRAIGGRIGPAAEMWAVRDDLTRLQQLGLAPVRLTGEDHQEAHSPGPTGQG